MSTIAGMTVLARAGAALSLRRNVLARRGTAVQCPLCGSRFDRFKDAWNRAGALCWRCGSHERHRLQWVLFQRHPELLAPPPRLLHFAPEWCLRRRLASVPGIDYVGADLEPDRGDVALDVRRLAVPDASFDAVICSHVLEHVDEDAVAMGELRRVVKPGGWLIALVPIDANLTETLEDPAVVTPEERLERYWQEDHVRLYGPDFAERLDRAGFNVTRVVASDLADAEERVRWGLSDVDWIHLCR